MAEQLEAQIEEVERKRRELEDSIRRIGRGVRHGPRPPGHRRISPCAPPSRPATPRPAALLPVDERDSTRSRIVRTTRARSSRRIEAAERRVFETGEEPAPRARPRERWTASTRCRCRCSRGAEGRARWRRSGRSRSRARARLHEPSSATCSPTSPARRRSRSRTPTSTADPAPGDHRRAHRALERPPLPRAARPGDRARAALQQPHRPGHGRHRQLQAGQRHLRAPAGRPRAEGGRAGPGGAVARHRLPCALRRRGDVGDPAPDRHRRRGDARRAYARGDRGARGAPPRRRRAC